MTSFVLGAALDRACSVLMEERVMRLTATEAERLDAAFEREPHVIPELAALLRQVNGRDVRAASRSVAAR